MSWVKALVPVPTSALFIDPKTIGPSPKGYSTGQLRTMARSVPKVYSLLDSGWSREDFRNAASSADPNQRMIGETYQHMFDPQSPDSALKASFNGKDLVVDNGNHRVLAARAETVRTLPVWVSAPDEPTFQKVKTACEARIQEESARLQIGLGRNSPEQSPSEIPADARAVESGNHNSTDSRSLNQGFSGRERKTRVRDFSF